MKNTFSLLTVLAMATLSGCGGKDFKSICEKTLKASKCESPDDQEIKQCVQNLEKSKKGDEEIAKGEKVIACLKKSPEYCTLFKSTDQKDKTQAGAILLGCVPR